MIREPKIMRVNSFPTLAAFHACVFMPVRYLRSGIPPFPHLL